ncbi:MAG: helix-turn-helix transcriptional regulator [Bacteroidales bacterium]|nr:helix-turn-helix transcriptional regulator [Bacteroidales bacterium]MCM1148088.1 helix-turn-helix transcriptional regulator [Bacteroidales bacterium]MCM1509456.1 helix-turn-helix transcriptional regulator [Clostridium sp.]
MNVDKLRSLFEQSTDKYATAKEIGTSYQSMYNILYKGSVPKVDLLEKIAKHYNVPVGYFFDEEPSTSDTSDIVTTLMEELVALRKQNEKLTDLLLRHLN